MTINAIDILQYTQVVNTSKKYKLLVMIPAYNEAKNISGVIKSVKEYVPEADILVINDGSRDATVAVARASGAHVVSHPFNLGYGVACQTGFKYAYFKNYDYVIQMDGDGQHEPACIPDLLAAIQEEDVDVVYGSRWLGTTQYNGPIIRKFGQFIFLGFWPAP